MRELAVIVVADGLYEPPSLFMDCTDSWTPRIVRPPASLSPVGDRRRHVEEELEGKSRFGRCRPFGKYGDVMTIEKFSRFIVTRVWEVWLAGGKRTVSGGSENDVRVS